MAARTAQAPQKRPPQRGQRPAMPKLGVIEGGRAAPRSSSPRGRTPAPGRSKQSATASSLPRGRERVGVASWLGAIGVVAAGVFGLVVLNIYVAQTSFRLNALQKEVAAEQGKYRQMRYEASMADSPARLAEAAARLGLVTPDRQESLTGRQGEDAHEEPAETEIGTGTRLKAVLAGRP